MGNGVPGGEGAEGVKGNTGIIIAILLLLGVGGGVLYFATRNKEEKKTVTTVTSAPSVAPPPPTMDLPSIDLPVDAGDETSVDAGKVAATYVNPCSATCSGTITDDIKKVVNARANTAKQCYKSAIQDNEALAGDMNFSLVIGSNGQTCSVNITSDTTGSSKLQQCVRQRLGVTYPAPKGGCAPIAGTISFRNKGS